MHVGVYGSGYLGTVISACLADFGTPVSCCDTDSTRMVEMAQGNICFFEKNLKEIVKRNVRCGRLSYSTDVEAFSKKVHVVFLAEDSAEHLEESVLRIARHSTHAITFALVTPVAVGTAAALERSLKNAKLKATIVSQPMFFTDGCAVEDFNWPDRIILGTSSNEAVSTLKQIFHSLVMRGVPVVVTNHETAELLREAATAFVATKISFINELATLCEKVNADAVNLALALGLDKKIAPRCLQPGAGMGGLFAESDMDSLAHLARDKGVELKVLTAAREVNAMLAERLVQKISGMVQSVQNKDVGILGLAFKPNTNSVAGSSSIRLAQTLVPAGCAGTRVRSRRSRRCQIPSEWKRPLLRHRVRGGRGRGRAGRGNGLAGIPHARFQQDQASAETAHHRRHEKSARLRQATRDGLPDMWASAAGNLLLTI